MMAQFPQMHPHCALVVKERLGRISTSRPNFTVEDPFPLLLGRIRGTLKGEPF